MPYHRQARIIRTLYYSFGVAMILFLVVPLIAIIPLSFSSGSFLSYPLPGVSLQWYERVFENGPWLSSLWNSMIIGSVSTVAATILGTLAAYAFARRDLPMPTAIRAFSSHQ